MPHLLRRGLALHILHWLKLLVLRDGRIYYSPRSRSCARHFAQNFVIRQGRRNRALICFDSYSLLAYPIHHSPVITHRVLLRNVSILRLIGLQKLFRIEIVGNHPEIRGTADAHRKLRWNARACIHLHLGLIHHVF